MIETRIPGAISLRISVTDRCMLRCRYCMPRDGGRQCRPTDILPYKDIVSLSRTVQGCFGLEKVRITGGEPLIRRNVEKLIEMLSGLEIDDIALTTNAQLLAGKAAILKRSGLRRVNISLDSLNRETFHYLSGGGSLTRTLQGIEAALHWDLRPVRLNMVVVRGINDSEVEDVLTFALDRGCELRFLELMPIGIAGRSIADRLVSSSEVCSRLSRTFEFTPLSPKPGQTSRRFRVTDRAGRAGTFGLISPSTAPFCRKCRRLRLTADGHLIGCLTGDQRFFVKPLLCPIRSEALKQVIERAMACKRGTPKFARQQPMAAIGG